MVSLVAIGSLGLVGYLISNNEEKYIGNILFDDDDVLVPKNEKSSNENIYHSTHSHDIFNDELKRAKIAHDRALANNYLYKDYPQTEFAPAGVSKPSSVLKNCFRGESAWGRPDQGEKPQPYS